MFGVCQRNDAVSPLVPLIAFTLWVCPLTCPATAGEQGELLSFPAQPQPPVGVGSAALPEQQLAVSPGFAIEFNQLLSVGSKIGPAERADREALKQFYAERQN